MSLHLALDDVQRLNAAVEALLSPLAGPSPDAWWHDAERRLRALFPGASAMLTVPDGDRTLLHSDSLESGALRLFDDFIPADPRTGRIRNVDASIEAWHAHRRRTRTEVWSEAGTLDTMTSLGFDARRSVFYNDALLAARMHGSFGIVTAVPGGELMLTMGYARRAAASRFGADDAAACALLLPAFRAAHHALATYATRHAALAATVDAAPEALLVTTLDGRELHRSAALRQALATEPERDRVLATMRAVAAEVAALRARPGAAASGGRAPVPTRSLDTALARWTIHAAFAPPHLWGVDDAVHVSLDRASADAPSADTHASLTPRDAGGSGAGVEGRVRSAVEGRRSAVGGCGGRGRYAPR